MAARLVEATQCFITALLAATICKADFLGN